MALLLGLTKSALIAAALGAVASGRKSAQQAMQDLGKQVDRLIEAGGARRGQPGSRLAGATLGRARVLRVGQAQAQRLMLR